MVSSKVKFSTIGVVLVVFSGLFSLMPVSDPLFAQGSNQSAGNQTGEVCRLLEIELVKVYRLLETRQVKHCKLLETRQVKHCKLLETRQVKHCKLLEIELVKVYRRRQMKQENS